MSSRYSSSPSSWLYLNFYQEFESYPKYGIIHYAYDSSLNQHDQVKYLEDSIRLARVEFADAYSTGKLTHWDTQKSNTGKFNLQFVVFVLDDHSDNPKPEASVIIPANEIFNISISGTALSEKYDLTRGDTHTRPSNCPIIEIHQENDRG